jgi:hypothetical protein
MMLSIDDAAAKGWWTWALKHGKPELPDTDEMRILLKRWEKGVGAGLEARALVDKPSTVVPDFAPYQVLKDHWQVCLIEIILAERKGLYEKAREAFFRPFKVDDSTRTRREFKSIKRTAIIYTELLLKRDAVSEAKRIIDFTSRRYSLEKHVFSFERAMVHDMLSETEEAYLNLARSLKKNRKTKAWLADGRECLEVELLFPFLKEQGEFDDFLKGPAKFFKSKGWNLELE